MTKVPEEPKGTKVVEVVIGGIMVIVVIVIFSGFVYFAILSGLAGG
jgi:hypothetical protein